MIKSPLIFLEITQVEQGSGDLDVSFHAFDGDHFDSWYLSKSACARGVSNAWYVHQPAAIGRLADEET